jgi:hypothetical protein
MTFSGESLDQARRTTLSAGAGFVDRSRRAQYICPHARFATMDEPLLQRPVVRCLTKLAAAEYLGIGITTFDALRIPAVRFGHRCVYDRIDLDAWLDDYKQRGRAGKEDQWPVSKGSTGARTLASGGLQQRFRTESAYAKALGLKTEKTPKPSSPS